MKKPEKPMMFIGNDELTQIMVKRYWKEFSRYQRRKRLLESLVLLLVLVLAAIAIAG